MFKKIITTARAHKIISVIIVVVAAGGGYYWYKSAQGSTGVTKYVVQAASQGTVIASVSGSGQVQAISSIPVKGQGGSGDVTQVLVRIGQHVAAGQLLVQLDTTNEQKALRQAQLNMQSAQLSLAKLQEAPATTTVEQDQDAIIQAEQSLTQASTSLGAAYQAGYDSLGSTFVDFQNVMAGLQNFVLGKNINKIQNDPDAFVGLLPSYLQTAALPYRDNVASTFTAATAAYQQNLADYSALNRNANPASLDSLFAETANTAKAINDASAASKELIDQIVNSYPTSSSTNPLPAIVNTDQNSFSNYIQTATGDITTITNTQSTISNDKTAIVNGQISLKEKQDSFASLQAGPDPLDVQSQQLSMQSQQAALQDAEQNLANDSIRAPVAGTISAIGAVVGTPVASSAVTLVADGDVAQVTLNEVDAAKVNLGNQTTLTFDALPNLSIAGQVAEIDPVGTVSQGVVSYNVQVSFVNNSTSTGQVKPGMSVTANIVTQADQNVVTVPNSAVVTQGGSSYVLEPASPVASSGLAVTGGILLPSGTKMVPVTIGISNATVTEITSGVSAGDQIITQTIRSSGSGSASAGGTNALRTLTGGGAGGGTFFGGGTGAGGARGGTTGGATGR